MSNNVEKQLDSLSNKILKEAPLDMPSLDFTDTVMSQIEAAPQSSVTKYKPLLPKQFWIVVVTLMIALLSYVFSNNTTITSGWFSKVNFDILPEFSISKIAVYTIVLFGMMVVIQVPILKNYFNKRLES